MTERWEREVDKAVRGLVDVPPMDALARARGRERLQAAIRSEEKGELMTITDAPPVVDITQRRRPRRDGVRWLAAAAAVVAVGAGGIAVVQSVGSDRPPHGPGSGAVTPAAQVLRRAADNLDTPGVGPGQYRYLETRQWSQVDSADGGKPFVILAEQRYEDWAPADLREQWLRRESASGRYKKVQGDEEYARAHGWTPPKPYVEERKADCGDFLLVKGEKPCAIRDHWPVRKGVDYGRLPDQSWIDSLPRDPEKLLRNLLDDIDRYGYSDDRSTAERDAFRTAVVTIESGLLPDDLTSALYRALALLPGIKVVENDATLNGRKGTALGMDFEGMRWVIIVDENTGELLGERHVVLDPDLSDQSDSLPAGTVMYIAAFRTAVVDDLGERPGK